MAFEVKELHFVLSREQNVFFRELADAICTELAELSVEGRIVEEFSALPGVIHVLLPPHEYYALEGEDRWPTPAALKRTILICAEQVGTEFFEENVRLARGSGATFDINGAAAREFERRGVAARHFQLGYTKQWDSFRGEARERDIDCLFLGCYSPRRAEYLAAYAPLLTERKTTLVLSDNSTPNTEGSTGFLSGRDKFDLLKRSKVLLNVHQGEAPYFEWLRILEALSNGCAVVSEHSTDFEPLVPNLHCLFGDAGSLDLLAHALLEDESRLDDVRDCAYEFVRQELPLQRSVEHLAEVAEELDRTTRSRRKARLSRRPRLRNGPKVVAIEPEPHQTDAEIANAVIGSALKDLLLEVRGLRRQIETMRLEATNPPPQDVLVDFETGAYGWARPRVSVLVSLFNYEHHVGQALDSVAALDFDDLEVVVLDDASTDGSRFAARRWLEAHEHVPAILARHPVNQGLPYARNAALRLARGEFCMILDADNELYPRCVDLLVEAAESERAAFAYGIIERFDSTDHLGLVSCFPWDPGRLAEANYIDAQALIRADVLREFGGYSTDPRLHGWEDYDLWCKVAASGLSAAFVPEVVGRYRVGATSMLSLTNLSTGGAKSLLRERYPDVFEAASVS
jgi:hypothetical protein